MRHVIPEWRVRAACREAEPEVASKFFPSGRPSNEPKKVCATCPVRKECLEYALSSPWRPAAIVAGMTPGELDPLWRQRHPDDTAQQEIRQLLGIR